MIAGVGCALELGIESSSTWITPAFALEAFAPIGASFVAAGGHLVF